MTQIEPLSKSTFARDKILAWIRDGRYEAGQRLPSERELATRLSMNHRTVRRGLEALVEDGLIIKQPRVGNFVADIKPRISAKQMAIALPRYMMTGGTGHPALASVVNSACLELDHSVFSLLTLSYRADHFWLDVGQLLVNREVQGVLVWPFGELDVNDVKRVQDAGIKMVLLYHHPSNLHGLGLCCVRVDRRPSLVQILEHLAACGHRRIKIGLYERDEDGAALPDAINQFAARHNLGGGEDLVVRIPNRQTPVDFEAVFEPLWESSLPPTALVVPDEFAAASVFRICYRRGIHIPSELSLAAVTDNTPDIHPVPLTAADGANHLTKAATLATQHLLRLLNGEQANETEICIGTNPRLAESVAPLKV